MTTNLNGWLTSLVLNGIVLMKKINKHIEIVRSSNKLLSSMGQKSCNMIKHVLEQQYERVGMTTVNSAADLDALKVMRPDLVFLGMKKVPTRCDTNPDAFIWLADYLEENNLNYTGSNAKAIALDFNKPEAKRVVSAAGLKTSDYFMASEGQYDNDSVLPQSFPLFVKPPNGGGGKGIGPDSVVHSFAAFESKVASIAYKFHTPALAEKYLQGREFSVGILENNTYPGLIAMPIELVASQNQQGDRILGRQIKAADTEQVMAVSSGILKEMVINLAINVFKVLGARDYGRIDIRLDAHGIPHFLEANLIPGLACHDFTSYFTTACWKNLAMDYRTMILHITEVGLARNIRPQALVLDSNFDGLPIPSRYPLPLPV